jgi:hypothetical protein
MFFRADSFWAFTRVLLEVSSIVFEGSNFSKFADRKATLRGVLDSPVKKSLSLKHKVLFGFLGYFCVERFRILSKITPSFPLVIPAL